MTLHTTEAHAIIPRSISKNLGFAQDLSRQAGEGQPAQSLYGSPLPVDRARRSPAPYAHCVVCHCDRMSHDEQRCRPAIILLIGLLTLILSGEARNALFVRA